MSSSKLFQIDLQIQKLTKKLDLTIIELLKIKNENVKIKEKHESLEKKIDNLLNSSNDIITLNKQDLEQLRKNLSLN